MKKWTRAWRRWGERAARWGLTLLLVGLVGVTVASGWWRAKWVRVVPDEDGRSGQLVALSVWRGRLGHDGYGQYSLHSGDPPLGWFEIRSATYVYLLDGLQAGYGSWPPQEPFSFWHIRHDPNGWSIALTYPIIAIALPGLFLWYRRLRRRYGRGLCVRCGYDLSGLAAVEQRITCPECGASNPAARILKRGLPGDPSPGARSAEPD